MKKILTIILLFLPLFLYANETYHFKWELPVNNRIEIVKTANILFMKNKRLQKKYEERNIIDLTCYERTEDKNRIKGDFSIYRKNANESVFQLEEKYNSKFDITTTGKFIVEKEFYMPNLRDVPSFPNRPLSPGDKWNAPAYLVLNNFSIPVILKFNTEYIFERTKVVNNKKYALIKYVFNINETVDKRKFPQDFPARIYGQNSGYLTWDMTEQKPVTANDMYQIKFIFANRFRLLGSYTFKMNIATEHKIYKNFTDKDKEKAKKELKDKIPEESGITVDTDKRGLVLRLGEILFDFDSYKLRPEARNTLNSAIKAIKEKYPDREIIVEGHTDNVGNKNYNFQLSEKRARSVASYLRKNSDHDKVSYRGLGQKNPIADNSTKKGRQKNRRVEIIIKLN